MPYTAKHKYRWRVDAGYRSRPVFWLAHFTAYAGGLLAAVFTRPEGGYLTDAMLTHAALYVTPLVLATLGGWMIGYVVSRAQVSAWYGIVASAALGLGYLWLDVAGAPWGIQVATLTTLFVLETVTSHYQAYGNVHVPVAATLRHLTMP